MKIYIDEKIPHSEHFFHSFNLETEKFSDSSFEIEKLDEESNKLLKKIKELI